MPTPDRSLRKVVAPSRIVSPGLKGGVWVGGWEETRNRRGSRRGREHWVPAPVRTSPSGPAPPTRLGEDLSSARQGQTPEGGARGFLGRRTLASLEQGAVDSPGQRKKRLQRQVLGVSSPRQERRTHYSRRAAEPSEPSRRHPLRSYTAWSRPRRLPPPSTPPLSLPTRGGDGRSHRPRDPSSWALTARAGRKVPSDWLLS